MIINWMSYSFFKIETQGKIIAVDPFGEKSAGEKPSRFKADIVLSSHSHDGHNNIDIIMGNPFVLSTPGEIEIGDVFVKGIKTSHDNEDGKKFGKNTVFVIDSEEIRLVHLGDFGEKKIKDSLIEKMGDVDILLIPISATYRTNAVSEAVDLIKQIEPKIVIPMHYTNEEQLNKFIKEIGTTPEKMDKLNIKANNLNRDEDAQMRLVVLQN